EWIKNKKCSTTKSLAGELQADRWAEKLLELNRTEIRISIEILTGHGNLNKHSHIVGRKPSPMCTRCDENKEESSIHFLCECPALMETRRRYLDSPFVSKEEVRERNLGQLLRFCKAAGYPTEP
ncbi:hypothetical protein, partial [Enterobacter cloacae complex sp. 4DZ3-17B2]|uniref:hypothetical protein n=1 Tax=Enterobacter cloacae complex sp. 4DZ3-17B2 TaxID=2511990 RepID=UPI001CA5AA1A